jgi:hypothetical protein
LHGSKVNCILPVAVVCEPRKFWKVVAASLCRGAFGFANSSVATQRHGYIKWLGLMKTSSKAEVVAQEWNDQNQRFGRTFFRAVQAEIDVN